MVRNRSRSRTSLTVTLALLLVSAMAMSRCRTRCAMSATTFASCSFRSARLPSANTRTGASYFRMRSTRPARWYSAPNAVFINPSMISLSVNVFFSTRWRDAMAAISADAGGETNASNAIAAKAAAMIRRACENRSDALIATTLPQPASARKARSSSHRLKFPCLGAVLVPHDHGGADGDAVIEIGYVFVAHAEAAGRYRLADRVRFVGAVNAIKRRAQIHGAGAERVVGAARHMARQVGPSRQHLRGRGPARPFPFRRDPVDAGPAKAVAADTDAVAKRLALRQDEIKPPLGGVYVNGARLILADKAHYLAPARA